MHVFQSELTNHWLDDFVFIISIIRPELFECKQIRKATNFGVMPNINRLTSAPVVTSQLFRCLSSVSHLLGCCLYFDGTLVNFQLKDSCLQAKQDPLNLLSLIEMPLRKPPKTLLNLSIDALVKHLSSYITRWALLLDWRNTFLVLFVGNKTLSTHPEKSGKIVSSLTSQNPHRCSCRGKEMIKTKLCFNISSLQMFLGQRRTWR